MDNHQVYNRLGCQIENHIRGYVPQGWIEPISKPCGVPSVMPDEARIFLEAFRTGKLQEALDEIAGTKDGRVYGAWYYQAAIKDFFEQDKHKSLEAELKNE